MTEAINLTRKNLPPIEWGEIKDEILGKKYNLGIVLAGNKLMKKLNKTHRNKNQPASTLSFSYSKNEGEIFLNSNHSKKEIIFLFIHSLLHLKGEEHGAKMEKLEKLYYNKFYEA